MTHPYAVSLQDAGELPSAARIAAETRFAKAIEHALGGADVVAAVFSAWTATSESDASEIDKDTANAAMRWPRAFDTAMQAGFRDLGEFPGAHFEVRLVRDSAPA